AEQMDEYRELSEQFGVTDFLGYAQNESEGRVLAVLDGPGAADGAATVEIFLDRTPFYAEAGGQVGDTGTIVTDSGTAIVFDTTYALPGLRRHSARVTQGTITPGQTATASIDAVRRDAIRRNHTGTHILHHALRAVLGQHVKQAGSLVGPDRLRFDFSHYSAVTDDEITRIEEIANREVLNNAPARTFETTKDEATALGAIAFFGDKYGDIVRVLEAGSSVELCGGTHVKATGDIGTIKIVGESSIGSNLRRIEAVTGFNSVALLQHDEHVLADAARLVGVPSQDLLDGLHRKIDEIKELNDEIKALRAKAASGQATQLAAAAVDGVIVARVDGLQTAELRDLAVAARQQHGISAVVLGGLSPTGGVALVAAVTAEFGVQAGDLIKDAARAVGGGGGGKGDIATAGGKNPEGLDEALRLASQAATKH
ncbi:MAG TPA: DHHA1 domain-containing protein, partial [Ilumatobacteraceae bacterium]